MNIEINENLFNTFKKAFPSSFFETEDHVVIESLLVNELRKNCVECFTTDELTKVESLYKFKKELFKIFDTNEFFIFNIKNTKGLTDYYGYQHSDNIIKEVALTLKENISENFVYRIAGDKFFSFGEFKGNFNFDEEVKIEVSHIEVKPELQTRRSFFRHPETLLDFILDVSNYEIENEFFKVKKRYILS